MVKLDDNVLLLDLLFTFMQEHYSNIAGMLRPFPCEIPPWNSIISSAKSMEFHGNRWNSMKLPWSIQGGSMEYAGSIHGVPWNTMEFHGMPWSSTESVYEVLMEVHGISWNIVEFHGMPWGSLNYRWSSMECHNVSIEFDRIPCSLYEKIHRNSVIKQLINLLTTCSSLHYYWIEKHETFGSFLKAE